MEKEVVLRPAGPGDEPEVVRLIRELAAAEGEASPVTEASVRAHMAWPGTGILLAERAGRPIGLLSYSVRPDLYHGAPTALIEELVVSEEARGGGVGGTLLEEAMRQVQVAGCAEIAVSTMSDNDGAQRFYRAHGLTDEAVLLERHF